MGGHAKRDRPSHETSREDPLGNAFYFLDERLADNLHVRWNGPMECSSFVGEVGFLWIVDWVYGSL